MTFKATLNEGLVLQGKRTHSSNRRRLYMFLGSIVIDNKCAEKCIETFLSSRANKFHSMSDRSDV